MAIVWTARNSSAAQDCPSLRRTFTLTALEDIRMRLHTSLLLVLLTTTGWAQTKPAPPPPPITFDQAVANEQNLFAADQKHGMDAIDLIVVEDSVDIA